MSRVRAESVEQWGVYEITLNGPSDGNPFIDVELSATFAQGNKSTDVRGYYDGTGIYKIRFMPDKVGEWSYETHANLPTLKGNSNCKRLE